MNAKVRRFLYRVMQKLLSIKPTQIAVIGFLMIILIGTLLLSLPFATRAPGSAPFLTALFTATSSTCVTGLVLEDTFTYWSGMGQSVILLLIQLGGLGFMTLVVIFAFLLHRTIGLRQRLVMAQLLNLNGISGVVRLMRHILIWTFLCEGIGAVILSIRFSLDFGVWGGIKKGVFHSVSAFCNAGFDIMGELGPGVSLTYYSADPTVVLTVCLLIIAGGLGFFVWEDIYTKRSFARFHLHTKLVLTMTTVLITAGTVLFFVFEYGNPATMGELNFGQRFLASFFQSVTTRTAGFNTIGQADMTEQSQVLTMILMAIGGSPGSTAGGIKTTTTALLLIAMVYTLRGQERYSIFGRNIAVRQVISALTIIMSFGATVLATSLLMSSYQDLPFMDILFENISAAGTVGLSFGITSQMFPLSQVILIFLMFFGRIGILTLSIALMTRNDAGTNIKFPEGKVIVG